MAGQDKPESQWHLSKTINITHILTTATVAIAVLAWFSTIDKRVSSNSQAIQYLTDEQRRAASRIETDRVEIRDDLKSISEKLDQIISSR